MNIVIYNSAHSCPVYRTTITEFELLNNRCLKEEKRQGQNKNCTQSY